VVAIPFIYWLATIELGLIFSNDNIFTLSFGQVLALFVAIPPVLEIVKLIPDLWYWFLDLTWIRRISRRPKSRRSTSDGESLLSASDGESLLSHSGKVELADIHKGSYAKLEG